MPALLIATMAIGLANQPEPMTLLRGLTQGYLLLPPKFVCEGQVKSLRWSQDNRYLVAVRTVWTLNRQSAKWLFDAMAAPDAQRSPADNAPFRNSVIVWNATERKTQSLWTGKTAQDECEQVALAGSALYVLVYQCSPLKGQPGPAERQASLLRGQLGVSTLQTVQTFPPGVYCRISAVDPSTRSVLLSVFGTDMKETLAMVSGIGLTPVREKRQLPKRMAEQLERGSKDVFGADSLVDDFGAGPSTGPQKELRLLLKTYTPPVKGLSATVQSLVCEDPKSEEKAFQFIASGVGYAFALASDNSALAYTVDNVLVVRELVPVSLEQLEKQREAAERDQMMSFAKQVGLAMMMFCADHNDSLPGNLSNDQILPYLKSPEVLNGFVYTFGGGKLSELNDPAGIELGYVVGKGGRAVIYADGHVIWKVD